MFRMLCAMFPQNRHQSMAGAHSRATPFSVHQEKPSAVPVSQKNKKEKKSDKSVNDDGCILNEAFDRLQDSIDHLNIMTEQKEQNGRYRPSRSGSRPYKQNPPFKPMITRWQRNRYSQSSPPFRRARFYLPAQYQHNRFPAHNRGSNRYRNDRYSDGCRGFQFDKSPRGRKPQVASKTPDQDRDQCYNCHEFGHFAHDCPYTEEPETSHDDTTRDAHPIREKRVPGRKQRNNNASFQFSNQDQHTNEDADELDDPELDT